MFFREELWSVNKPQERWTVAGELVRPPVMICSTAGKEEALRISAQLNSIDYRTISRSRHNEHYLLYINAIHTVGLIYEQYVRQKTVRTAIFM